MKWWGYLHIHGHIQVKLMHDIDQCIAEAIQSPFCRKVFMPFEAKDREDAILIIKGKIYDELMNEDDKMNPEDFIRFQYEIPNDVKTGEYLLDNNISINLITAVKIMEEYKRYLLDEES